MFKAGELNEAEATALNELVRRLVAVERLQVRAPLVMARAGGNNVIGLDSAAAAATGELADRWSAEATAGESPPGHTITLTGANHNVSPTDYDLGLAEGAGNAILKVPANSGPGVIRGGVYCQFITDIAWSWTAGFFPVQQTFNVVLSLRLVEVDAAGNYVTEVFSESAGSMDSEEFLHGQAFGISLDTFSFGIQMVTGDGASSEGLGEGKGWAHETWQEMAVPNHDTDKYYAWRLTYTGGGFDNADYTIIVTNYGTGSTGLFFRPATVTASGP